MHANEDETGEVVISDDEIFYENEDNFEDEDDDDEDDSITDSMSQWLNIGVVVDAGVCVCVSVSVWVVFVQECIYKFEFVMVKLSLTKTYKKNFFFK